MLRPDYKQFSALARESTLVPVVKSVSGAVGLASVKLATWPEKEFPSVALTAVPLAVKAASAALT